MSLDSIDEVACRPDELRLMISQIILNAIEAMPDGGDLTIDTSQKGQTLVFTAGDTGTGIRTCGGIRSVQTTIYYEGRPGCWTRIESGQKCYAQAPWDH